MSRSNTEVSYDAYTKDPDQLYNIDDISAEVHEYNSIVSNAGHVLNNDHNIRDLIDIEAEVDQYISDIGQAAREE